MDEETSDNGSSAQMKCPCCGEMISMSATKGGSAQDDGDGDEGWEEGFRQSMSPRNDEQPA